MLSLQMIREQTDAVRAGLKRRGEAPPIDEILRLDERRRALLVEIETLRARRNDVSRDVGRMKTASAEAVDAVRGEMRQVGATITNLEGEIADVETQLQALVLEIPNIPDASVPDGTSEDDNVVIGHWGTPKVFDHPPRPHWELGTALNILDFERGVKLSGTRFYLLRGAGAALQRGLIQWLLDLHTREHGYVEINVPYMLKREQLVSAAQLPRFADNLYHDDQSDLWFIPTAEAALANIYAGEILDAAALPKKMVAYTACFRREQTASGKDTRGIKRGHQFDKVEMFQIVEPGTDLDVLEQMLDDACDCLRGLEIPHRRKLLCTADIAFQSAKTYDVEAWAPGVDEWLEVSSCSTVREFQSRRAGLRYRRNGGARPEFPYELNGSGLGVPRTMIAIMENYQQPDGSIVVPDVLRPYLGGREIITVEA